MSGKQCAQTECSVVLETITAMNNTQKKELNQSLTRIRSYSSGRYRPNQSINATAFWDNFLLLLLLLLFFFFFFFFCQWNTINFLRPTTFPEKKALKLILCWTVLSESGDYSFASATHKKMYLVCTCQADIFHRVDYGLGSKSFLPLLNSAHFPCLSSVSNAASDGK